MKSLNLNEMTEKRVKETLKDLKEVHNSMTQQVYKLREKISLFQRVLLAKQRERIMAANAQKIKEVDTSELEEKTGLTKEEILKGMMLIRREGN